MQAWYYCTKMDDEGITITELEARIQMLREQYIRDPLSVAAYSMVKVWSFIAMLLIPIGWVTAFVIWGVIFVPILRLPIFALQALLYFPMLGVLWGTSWLWFRFPYLRPLLIIPGVLTAIIASTYLTTIGVERDDVARFIKLSDAEDWPLTSLLSFRV